MRKREALPASDNETETLSIDELSNDSSRHYSDDGVFVHKYPEPYSTEALLSNILSTSESRGCSKTSYTYFHFNDSLSSAPSVSMSDVELSFFESDSSAMENAPVLLPFDPKFYQKLLEDSQDQADRIENVVETDATGVYILKDYFKIFNENTECVDVVLYDSKSNKEPKVGTVWKKFRDRMKDMAAGYRDFIPSVIINQRLQ